MSINNNSICQNSDKVVAKSESSPLAYLPSNRWAFELTILIWLLTSAFVFVIVPALLKHRYARMKVRRMSMIVLYPVAIVFYAMGEILPKVIGLILFPCWINTLLLLLIVPWLGAMQFGRNATFLLMTKLANSTYLYGRMTAEEELRQQAMLGLHEKWTVRKRIMWTLHVTIYGLSQFLKPGAVLENEQLEERVKSVMALTFMVSSKGLIIFIMSIFSPFFLFAVLIVITDPAYLYCNGCERTEFVTYVIIAEAIFFVGIGLSVSIRARNLPDRWGVLREGRLSLAWTFLAFLGFALYVWVPTTGTAYSHTFIVSLGLLGAGAVVSVLPIYTSIQSEGFYGEDGLKYKKQIVQFNRNKMASKRIEESLADSDNGTRASNATGVATARFGFVDQVVDPRSCPKLHKILIDDELKKAYEDYLKTEIATEGLFFLSDAWEWRRAYFDLAPNARCARAKRISQSFISPQGVYAINISNALEILDKIQKGSKDLSIPETIFDDAREQVAHLLEVGSVMRFELKSKEFRDQVSGKVVLDVVAGNSNF